MKPLFDRVCITQHKAEERTKGGLIIPDSAQKKPNLGVVHAIGPKVKDVKVGDIVLLRDKWFNEFTFKGVESLIVNEPDIVAIMESGDIG